MFWISEIENGLYQIEFGNGVIGKAINPGSIVRLEYMKVNFPDVNGIKSFKYTNGTVLNSVPKVFTISQSSGGMSSETIDSIRFNAPRAYAAQNRAVTSGDYQYLVKSLVASADSVSVWSGADSIPPEYGRVFICIKPKFQEYYTSSEKNIIVNDILTHKSVISISPVIVDPSYMYIEIVTSVYYNPRMTSYSESEITLLIKQAIAAYNTTELGKFGGVMRFSKLNKIIDNSEKSIVSNISRVLLHRKIIPKFGYSATYNINLINPIVADTTDSGLRSTGFKFTGSLEEYFLEDDGLGNILAFYYINASAKRYKVDYYGSIDYGKGIINLVGINMSSITGTDFFLRIRPVSYDIATAYDQLISIDQTRLSVIMNVDTISLGQGGETYQFSSGRS